MGDVHFKIIGPAAYRDNGRTITQLAKLTKSAVHWDYKAVIVATGAIVCEGRAIRPHAQLQDDGNISSLPIPDDVRRALSQPGNLTSMDPVSE